MRQRHNWKILKYCYLRQSPQVYKLWVSLFSPSFFSNSECTAHQQQLHHAPAHSSVGLDLRTEKSGFFAIWTGLGLDLTSYAGLRILAFVMECQSIPSHQTLKQKNCQNWTNFLLFCICDTVNFKTFDKIKTSGAYVDIKIIGYNFDQYNPWTWLWNWIGL